MTANALAGLAARAPGGAVGIAGVDHDGADAACAGDERRAANLQGSGDHQIAREQSGGTGAGARCDERKIGAG